MLEILLKFKSAARQNFKRIFKILQNFKKSFKILGPGEAKILKDFLKFCKIAKVVLKFWLRRGPKF